ncbi:DUF5777 family beta-barrel protein [Pinibacter aurantiacus]|uniref:DUF5777 domain-containing protein n=1 Tax=Pinibacter aurantiacus TaxID=2851599 RepID=A0A9E2S984_9BACT|nr:DUF5777 family beta-barrel protein [Pinibacter aurantiacus]MBV4357223.1 hypothetical protein [Pinibacter aurantiacus]
MSLKKFFCSLIIIITIGELHAQDSSLLKSLNDSMQASSGVIYTTGTFKALHVINMQTVEAPGAGVLDFVIQHRFGQLNSGAYNLWGLDNATLRLGLDYGISSRLAIGIGRSSYEKMFDGYVKYKLLRQSTGAVNMPVSVSLLGSINHFTQHYDDKPYLDATYRTAYTAQLLIARKFNRNISFQLVPTFLHYNIVPTADDKNNQFAISAGGRVKFTKRMAITAEYNYLLPNQVNSMDVYNSFSLGWDIETGGHVFQLVFTNSQGMVETQYIGRTLGKWGDGAIYFGFNISRSFNITKKAKNRVSW